MISVGSCSSRSLRTNGDLAVRLASELEICSSLLLCGLYVLASGSVVTVFADLGSGGDLECLSLTVMFETSNLV
jgi:hypothetical protein